jgi:HEAT repeat protein
MGCAVIRQFHLSWKFPEDKPFAPWALAVLGTNAETAIPELTKLLNDKKRPLNAERAANALKHLGNAGLPPLLSILTNHIADLRLRHYVAIEHHAISNPRTTSAALEHMLKDPDPAVRCLATNALREIDPTALTDGTVGRGGAWRVYE